MYASNIKNTLALLGALSLCFFASLSLDLVIIGYAKPFSESLRSILGGALGNIVFFALIGCLMAPIFIAFRKICLRVNVRKEGWAFSWALVVSFIGFILPHWTLFPETGPSITLLCGLMHLGLLIGFAIAGSRPARRSLRGFCMAIVAWLRLKGIHS